MPGLNLRPWNLLYLEEWFRRLTALDENGGFHVSAVSLTGVREQLFDAASPLGHGNFACALEIAPFVGHPTVCLRSITHQSFVDDSSKNRVNQRKLLVRKETIGYEYD
jgi:hypothetical protein